MTVDVKPPADVAIDSSLVRALLQSQHPDLAHLALADVGEGWDNRLFRLGDDLAVRLPRRAPSADLIAHEQRWLPLLSPGLPLAVPVPVRHGRPGSGFPWAWSIVRWFPGESALHAPPRDLAPVVVALAGFLRALHQPAPHDAPLNPWRGVALAARSDRLREHVRQLQALIDGPAVLGLWEQLVSAPQWPGPPLWIHGDLHPGNLLIDGGALSAVIDFGDMTAGDPATDLSVVWILRPTEQSAFLASARQEFRAVDDDTWTRARGWALALGLTYLASSRGDELMGALGRATIDAVLTDTAR